MAQISVKTSNLKSEVNSLNSISVKLNITAIQLDLISAELKRSGSMEAYQKVARSISSASSNIRYHKSSVSGMKSGLEQICNMYRDTENDITGTVSGAQRILDYIFGGSLVEWLEDNNLFSINEFEETDGWNSTWSSFWEDLKRDGKFEDSYYESALGISGAIFGEEFIAKIGHKVGNVEVEGDLKSEWDISKGEFGTEAKGSLEGSLWEGYAEADYGLLSKEASIGLLTGAVSGEAAFGLMKDGKFNPEFNLGAKAEGSVLNGEIKNEFGTDDLNVHSKAEGEFLGAEAEAGIKIDKEGFKAGAGAEAYMAKGEVSGGIEIFGIKIDVEVEGKLGAVGAKVGAAVEETSVEAEIGASLLGGAGLKVKVDWEDLVKNIKSWKW